jgi:hypothetical protein
MGTAVAGRGDLVILPGDFACCPISGDAGKLVSLGEWLNGDGFSHSDHAEVYVGLADASGRFGYTMGAYPGGARLVPLRESQLEDGNGFLWSTGKISLTADQRNMIVLNAMACKGIPYSAADYLALAAHRLHVPVPGLRDYIADSGHMICSQLVDWCYMRAGVHLFADGRWAGYVTPADLANLLEGR